MIDVLKHYQEGVVVRLFNPSERSMKFEMGEKAASMTQCATLILEGIPIALMNNMPCFSGMPKFGYLYAHPELDLRRAFKNDIYSDRFADRDAFKDFRDDKGKLRVPLPDRRKGGTKYHRDYETIAGITEKVVRMFNKYRKKMLWHNELFVRAKDPTDSTRRIIGILIDESILKDIPLISKIIAFTLEHLPRRSLYLYDETKGQLTEVPIAELAVKLLSSKL